MRGASVGFSHPIAEKVGRLPQRSASRATSSPCSHAATQSPGFGTGRLEYAVARHCAHSARPYWARPTYFGKILLPFSHTFCLLSLFLSFLAIYHLSLTHPQVRNRGANELGCVDLTWSNELHRHTVRPPRSSQRRLGMPCYRSSYT